MPPPFSPTTYGKRQTFPIPIAQPALTSKKPRRDLKDSRFTNPSSSFNDFCFQSRKITFTQKLQAESFVYFIMMPFSVSMTQTVSILIFTVPFSAVTDARLPLINVIIGGR